MKPVVSCLSSYLYVYVGKYMQNDCGHAYFLVKHQMKSPATPLSLSSVMKDISVSRHQKKP